MINNINDIYQLAQGNVQSNTKQAIADLFNDSRRAAQFSVAAANLFLDYSKQNISTIAIK